MCAPSRLSLPASVKHAPRGTPRRSRAWLTSGQWRPSQSAGMAVPYRRYAAAVIPPGRRASLACRARGPARQLPVRRPLGGTRHMTVYAPPGQPGSPAKYASRYENFIGGEWVPPAKGQYFENVTPVTGRPFTEIARSTAEDIELALDAAHGAAPGWGRTSAADRSAVLLKIADRMEQHLETIAVAETW